MAFGSEPTTGLYRIGAGEVGFSVGGVQVLDIRTGLLGHANGAVGAPSITFTSDLLSGLYRIGVSDVGMSIAGVRVMEWTPGQINTFGGAFAGTALLQHANASTVATQDSRQNINAGSSGLSFYVANQNRATAVLTGGPTTPQAAIYTTNAIPLILGAAGNACASLQGGTLQVYDAAGAPAAFDAGYRDLPLTIITADYSTLFADRGKMIRHASAAVHTATITDGAGSYPNGSALAFFNLGPGALNIAMQTNTANLIWIPSCTSGTRSLAQWGFATAVKYFGGTPGTWIINGVGLS
jgi:hypothetical protein